MNALPLKALLDIMFPRACAGCGGNAGDEFQYLCWNCLAAIKLVTPPYCLLCGDPVYGEISNSYVCSNCVRRKPHFDCARSAAIYTGLTKEMILDFKYRGAVWLGPDLGQLMGACLRANFHPEHIDLCSPASRERKAKNLQPGLPAGQGNCRADPDKNG
jgi:predicted amidophosphoribosyltransferase